MRQQTSPAIVLRRTDYAEADRIVTFLTPIGKVRAIVKGVRRSKSKMAGGIELFSENTVTFMQTRGDLARVVSTRLEIHWEGIVGDLQRMMFGYEAMKLLDKRIEDEAERAYYDLLRATLEALGDSELPLTAVQTWFYARLMTLEGTQINTDVDSEAKKFATDTLYDFLPDTMNFQASTMGHFRPEHIKLLRLIEKYPPPVMKQVKGIAEHSKLLKDLFTIQLAQYTKT